MAILTATPNPIGVYGSGSGSASVHWDMEQPSRGIVYFSIDGADEEKLGGPQDQGSRVGDLPLTLNLGQSCRLSLKDPGDTSVELKSLVVTTYDLRLELAEGFAQAYLPQLRPQLITNLVVRPGVDTVFLSFRTTRPTIPTIGLFDASGAYVDGRMGLFGGLQTRHSAEFGLDRPLALGTTHRMVIDAFGPSGNASSPNKVTKTVDFVSGTRSADVSFESVNVHDDGDEGIKGAGEFCFSFAVGDRATRARIGDHAWWPARGVALISHDDPPRDVGVTLPIPSAPRVIWAQVIATDDDTGTLPGQDDVAFFLRPEFEGEGTWFYSRFAADHASITVSFDLGTESGRFAIPFDMATGDFSLDYVMSGHIFVRANAGAVISTLIGKGRPIRRSSFLTEPGDVVSLSADGTSRSGRHLVALGADGAAHYLPLEPELRARQEALARFELPCAGTVSVSASPDGSLDLLCLDPEGGVRHSRPDLKKGKAPWRRLGGRLREVRSLGVSGKAADATLSLAGIGRDDGLQVADVKDGRASWVTLVEGPVRAISTVSIPKMPDAILALGDDGAITHVERRRGGWRTQRHPAHWPGEAPPQALSTAMTEEVDAKSRSTARTLIIAAMSEDMSVRLLRWPDYPSGVPAQRWENVGSVQDLLVEPPPGRRTNPPRAKTQKGPSRSRRK